MPRVKSLCVTHDIVSVTWHCNATVSLSDVIVLISI